MKMKKWQLLSYKFTPVLITFCILIVGAILGAIIQSVPFTPLLSLAFGLTFLYILPGYAIMLNFNFDTIERLIIGVPISIAIIGVGNSWINTIFGSINAFTSLLLVVLCVAISIIWQMRSSQQSASKSRENEHQSQ